MRVKGASTVVAVVLLIVIAAALAIGVWYSTQRYTKGTDVIQAEAYKLGNTYLSTGEQVATVGIKIVPKTDNYYTITSITLFVTTTDGNVHQKTITLPASGQQQIDTNLKAYISGPTDLKSGSSVTLTIAIQNSDTSNHIASVSANIELQDASQKTYSATTNQVDIIS